MTRYSPKETPTTYGRGDRAKMHCPGGTRPNAKDPLRAPAQQRTLTELSSRSNDRNWCVAPRLQSRGRTNDAESDPAVREHRNRVARRVSAVDPLARIHDLSCLNPGG